MPAVTLADRASLVLTLLAAAFIAYAAWRQGAMIIAGVAIMGGAGAVALQATYLTKSRRGPRRWLEVTPGSGVVLLVGNAPPAAVTFGSSTRWLGGSVYVDAQCAQAAGTTRIRCWLTPFDVPRDVLRRWTIVLLAGERVASRDGSPVPVA